MISIVWDGLKPDITPERFKAIWTSAQVTRSELPKTALTFLHAQAESLSEKELDAFYQKLGQTVKVCASNLKDQQFYIDKWRELSRSGLFELPENKAGQG